MRTKYAVDFHQIQWSRPSAFAKRLTVPRWDYVPVFVSLPGLPLERLSVWGSRWASAVRPRFRCVASFRPLHPTMETEKNASFF
jgi:hypothetical protein